MKYFIFCVLFCFGWCGSFQTIHADPIVELSYTYTTINVPGSTFTSAYGINNSGQIVGAYTDSTGAGHGFLDTDGTFTTLPFVPTGINNVGQMVGLSSTGLILDTNGVITDIALTALPNFGGFPYGGEKIVKINDLGQIVGNYYDQYFGNRGFIYSNGIFTLIRAANPFLNEEGISAHGINNAGQILVTIEYTGGTYTYLYQDEQYTPIFTLQQDLHFVSGVALNNVGQALGYIPIATYIYTNGVVGYIHLPQPNAPYDINDAGVIVGENVIATPVPEPHSLLLFAGGLAVLGLLRRRRQRPLA